MKALITRPSVSADVTEAKLVGLGFEVLLSPVLEIVTLSQQKFNLDYRAVVFTSVNAVNVFVKNNPSWLSVFAGFVFSVGPRTSFVLGESGATNIIEGDGDAESLLKLIIKSLPEAGAELLWPRGQHVKLNLVDELTKHDIKVHPAVMYQAKEADCLSSEVVEQLKAKKITVMPFYSARTATTFIKLAKESGVDQLSETVAVALSEAVAKELQAFDWLDVITSKEKNEEALMCCVNSVKLKNVNHKGLCIGKK